MNDEGWQEVKLKNVGKVITGKTPSSKKEAHYWGEEIPFITPTDISGDIYCKTSRSLSKTSLEKFQKILLPPNSICLTCIASIGKMCITTEPSVTNQQINSIVVEKEKFDTRFIFYYLKSIVPELHKMAGGSVSPIINKSSLENLTLKVPNLKTQKKIASILSALDDRIEHNNKLARLLEENAQALYQSWFVRFDPVRAKERGEVPRGINPDQPMEKELADLFPDKIDPDTGLPEGWSKQKLEIYCNARLGGTPSKQEKSYWENGTIAWVNSGKVNEFRIFEASEMITQKAYDSCSAKLLPVGTTVIAITGATLGQISMMGMEACANQSVIGLVPKENFVSNSYIYLNTKRYLNNLLGNQTGAAQAHVNLGDVKSMDFLFPGEDILLGFSDCVNEYFSLIDYLLLQNQSLVHTRDHLLPRLVSGKIDVGAAKEEAEKA